MLRKLILAFVLTIFISNTASASGLRFGFLNPSFGGNPFNASYMLSMADKQNQSQKVNNKEDPASVEGFKKQLQTQLLSTTAGKISKLVTDTENPLEEPVKYAVDDLTIEIIPINPETGQYQIVISDGISNTVIDVFNNIFS